MKPAALILDLKQKLKELSSELTIYDFNLSEPKSNIISRYKAKLPSSLLFVDENILNDAFLMNSLWGILENLDIDISDIPSKKLIDRCLIPSDNINNPNIITALSNLVDGFNDKVEEYETDHGISFDERRTNTDFFQKHWQKFKDLINMVIENKELIQSLDPVNKYQPFGILDRGLLKTPLKSKDIILLMYHHRDSIGNYNLIPDRFFKSKVRDEFGNKFYSKKDSIRTAIDRIKKDNSGIMPTPTNYVLGFSDSFIKYFKDHPL